MAEVAQDTSLPTEADAATVQGWIDDRRVVVVDVREASEFDYEHIPGSVLLPLSFLDPDFFPPITERPLVLVCAIGKRSLAAGKQLIKGGITNVVNLTGGLAAWKEAGLETQGARFDADDYVI